MHIIKKADLTLADGTLLKARVYRDTEWNEYQVVVGASSYHTDDRLDALGTLPAMIREAGAAHMKARMGL